MRANGILVGIDERNFIREDAGANITNYIDLMYHMFVALTEQYHVALHV